MAWAADVVSTKGAGGVANNDETVLREVDEAMAEDRQREFFQRNGSLLIGGGAAIVLAVAGWQFWNAQKTARAEQAAMEFSTAIETLATAPQDGRTALEGIAEGASEGYAVLAELRRAASLAGSDRAGALAIYRKVYGDGGAPKRLRDLARLRAASLAFPDGRDAILVDLGSLPESGTAFGYYAGELAALATLQAKDYQTAESMFTRLAADPLAPQGLRQRAEELAALAAAGGAGVNLTGEARVDDLLRALGESSDSGAPEETAGGEDGGAPTVAAPEDDSSTGEEQ